MRGNLSLQMQSNGNNCRPKRAICLGSQCTSTPPLLLSPKMRVCLLIPALLRHPMTQMPHLALKSFTTLGNQTLKFSHTDVDVAFVSINSSSGYICVYVFLDVWWTASGKAVSPSSSPESQMSCASLWMLSCFPKSLPRLGYILLWHTNVSTTPVNKGVCVYIYLSYSVPQHLYLHCTMTVMKSTSKRSAKSCTYNRAVGR
jgi:hypothetical protein